MSFSYIGPEPEDERRKLWERSALIRRLLPELDSGIAAAVVILLEHGVETYESCEGGDDHPYLEPTVRFHGKQRDGIRALGIALASGLPVATLSRIWPVDDKEPTGPYWALTFSEPVPCSRYQGCFKGTLQD